MSLYKTKDYSQPKRVKSVYGGKKKNKKIKNTKTIWINLFKLKSEIKAMKDSIIRDIRTFFWTAILK